MAAAVERFLEVRRLGRTQYEEAYSLQKDLVEARSEGRTGDVLLLTEHEAVLTVGRGAVTDHLEGLGLPVVEVERGGEVTYHGPGQLVCYPILQLPEDRRDLHRFLRDLEEVVIGVLGEFQIAGERREGYTGVWIGPRKICSIGVAVRRWITYHGFAINLHTDLQAFRGFKPCGLEPDVMTRLADHVELPPTNLLGEVLIVKHFCRVFGYELPPATDPGAETEKGFPPLPLI